MPVMRLVAEGFEITGWYMNPNIQPLSEYLRRAEAAEICAYNLGIGLVRADETWNLEDWLEHQLPLARSKSRCVWCTQSRLEAAYAYARAGGYEYFSTSLLYSRYQPHEAIAARGRELGEEGPQFVYRDFREDWLEGIDRSRKMGLYRQPYCGCVFSEAERYAKKLGRPSHA